MRSMGLALDELGAEVFLRMAFFLGKHSPDFVKQISDAGAVLGGDGNDVAKAGRRRRSFRRQR